MSCLTEVPLWLYLPAATYHWRAKARYADATEWSDWSVPDSFVMSFCPDEWR